MSSKEDIRKELREFTKAGINISAFHSMLKIGILIIDKIRS